MTSQPAVTKSNKHCTRKTIRRAAEWQDDRTEQRSMVSRILKKTIKSKRVPSFHKKGRSALIFWFAVNKEKDSYLHVRVYQNMQKLRVLIAFCGFLCYNNNRGD